MRPHLLDRAVFSASAVVMALLAVTSVADDRKDATSATRAANDQLLQYLPFSDQQAFEDAHKGFIAPLPQAVIKGQAGNPAAK